MKLDSGRNCGIDSGQCPSSNSSKESEPQTLQEQIDLAWRGMLKNQEKDTHGPWAVPVHPPLVPSQHLFFNNAVISEYLGGLTIHHDPIRHTFRPILPES